MSKAQLQVIESNLSRDDKADTMHRVVESAVENGTDPVTHASGLVRARLVERFGGKASKEMKGAYLQLLAACIHSGRPLEYADVAMENYFELFGK